MKSVLIIALLILSQFTLANTSLTLNVSLSPAGSFQAISSKVKGELLKKDNVISSDKLTVTVESFKTGIDLRDEHFWKHLKSDKFPKITLSNLKATDGKATADLEICGVKKQINIEYKEGAEEVEANFEVKNSDFNLDKVSYLGVGVEDLIKINVKLPMTKK